MQKKEKKGIDFLNRVEFAHTDSHNNIRGHKRKSKGGGAGSEGTPTSNAFGSDVLKISICEKSYIGISELISNSSTYSANSDVDYISIAEKLYELLEHNPSFQLNKVSFDSKVPLSRVISQLFNQAKRIAKENKVEFLGILGGNNYNDEDKIQFYIYRKYRSEEVFNGVELCFLNNIKEEAIYPLLFDMLSIFFNQQKVMFWNDYEEDCALTSIEERLEYELEEFEDNEQIAAYKEVIKYYHEGAPKQFTTHFFENKISIEELEINHSKFIPSKPFEKDFHRLIKLGIELLKMPYTIDDFYPDFLKYNDDRMLEPHQYLRFIWDYNDLLWEEVHQNIDAIWESNGQAQPILARRLTGTNMGFELEKTRFPEKLQFFLKSFSKILLNHKIY